jgi:hypothetical protein
MGTGAWGAGTWGAGSWGGGPGGIELVDVVALRENALRLEFTQAVYFTELLDAADASRPEIWLVTEVEGSSGIDGNPVRPVRAIKVELAGEADSVGESDYGRFVNLILDRPMTPWPAVYSVSWTDVYSADLGSSSAGSQDAYSVYRELEVPQIQQARTSRDFANPQTLSAAREALPLPFAEHALGSFGVDDSGDYAMDEGTQNLKKRVIRRLTTRKGAFAHLPNYGVGVPDEAKRLGTAATLSRLRVDAEAQISEEPDVARVRVAILASADRPDLVRFRVAVRPKVGPPVAFDVPFSRAA